MGDRLKRDLSGTLRKQSVTKFTPGADLDRSFVFVASDGTVDRMGDTIAPEGWDLARYRSNPTILFAHDSSGFPVGKSLREWVEGGQLKSQIQFTSQEENPVGYQTMKLIEGGFLRAVSVGFHPIESKIATERDDGVSWIPPMDFTKQELLEISVVPVPANPNALLQARAAGLEVGFVVDWAERVLSQARGAGLWVKREGLEATISALTEPKIIIDLAPSVKTAPSDPAVASVAAHTAPSGPGAVLKEAPKVEGMTKSEFQRLVKAALADRDSRARMAKTGKL